MFHENTKDEPKVPILFNNKIITITTTKVTVHIKAVIVVVGSIDVCERIMIFMK